MARTLSGLLRQQINRGEMDEVFLWLVTLSHPTMPTPIRVVNDRQDIVSRGNTFQAYAFLFELPEDDGETIPRGRLVIDNVDRSIVDEIRTLTTPMTCLIEGVLASQPDYVEITLQDIMLREIKYNAQTISGTLYVEDYLNKRVPADTFNPSEYEGLFR